MESSGEPSSSKTRLPSSVGYKICNVCGQSVIINHLKNHARVKHLKAPVAQCPECGHEELWHVSNMRKHIREVHSDCDAEPIVIPIDKDTVKMWKDKCFLGASSGLPQLRTPKGKGSRSANKHVQHQVMRAQDQMQMSHSDDRIEVTDDGDDDVNNTCLPLKKRKLSNTETSTIEPQFKQETLQGLICASCHVVVSPERAEMHVRTHHTGQSQYKCSLCNFATIWYEEHIRQHIDKYHANTDAVMITVPPEQVNLSSLMHTCFPKLPHVQAVLEKEFESVNANLPEDPTDSNYSICVDL